MNGFGEDQAAHDDWTKLHEAATRAISDYEIYELALAAEKAKLKIELVDQGLPVWRAEMTLVLASVNHETDIGKAVLALRKAREDKEKAMLLRDAARNRAWKR